MRTMATVAAVVLAAGVAWAGLAEDVSGSWKSAAVEDLGNGSFGTRVFTFKKSEWNLVFTMYADREQKAPLFAFEASGPFTVGAASAAVPGASEAQFRFTQKKLTLLGDDAAAQKLGFASCGLTRGKAVDISKTGCSFLRSVADAGEEFDLLKLEGDKLFLGRRPADGNMGSADRRPKAVGAPLVKAK